MLRLILSLPIGPFSTYAVALFCMGNLGCGGAINAHLRSAIAERYPACVDVVEVRVFKHNSVEGVEVTLCGEKRRFVSFDSRATWTEDRNFAPWREAEVPRLAVEAQGSGASE